VLSLPHPTSQLALSLIIARHYDNIRAVIESSNITLYNTAFGPTEKRAFIGLDFKARGERESQILARYPVIMTADIANFFHTIYSHSLPWAVLGKEQVKNIRESGDKAARDMLEEHWASQLDLAIQRGNSRETFGIPVGPDTSRIVAEILLSGIHRNEVFGKVVAGRLAYRLVDDFLIGFEDEGTARRCQDALRRALWDYNLHLNESKTRIVYASTVFDSGWKYEIDNFPLQSKSPAGAGSIVNGRYWLPHYEAVHRGWTSDQKIIEETKADPLFSRLLKAKITFLDDSDFLKRAQPPPVRSRGRIPRLSRSSAIFSAIPLVSQPTSPSSQSKFSPGRSVSRKPAPFRSCNSFR
jgi:hypothetical protein